MSEAIISRRGRLNQMQQGKLITKVFSENEIFVPPDGIIGNTVSVRLFGGGGPGSEYGGGGGGWMNNGEIEVVPGSPIPITIGDGGTFNIDSSGTTRYGGTTSFGMYLSANGGSGSGELYVYYAGSGGSGGGMRAMYVNHVIREPSGIGYQFGGGGGGGNGGPWGGGGGGMEYCVNRHVSYNPHRWEKYQYTSKVGAGGTYGGNGGLSLSNAENGTNTMDNHDISADLRGPAIFGATSNTIIEDYNIRGGGGGGGYGGNGGNGGLGVCVIGLGDYQIWSLGGGGGGGYGGGAYGGHGGNSGGAGGGGGYGSGHGGDGIGGSSGGGGGYGVGGDMNNQAKYGGGGASISENGSIAHTNGGSGICIIQYYA